MEKLELAKKFKEVMTMVIRAQEELNDIDTEDYEYEHLYISMIDARELIEQLHLEFGLI